MCIMQLMGSFFPQILFHIFKNIFLKCCITFILKIRHNESIQTVFVNARLISNSFHCYKLTFCKQFKTFCHRAGEGKYIEKCCDGESWIPARSALVCVRGAVAVGVWGWVVRSAEELGGWECRSSKVWGGAPCRGTWSHGLCDQNVGGGGAVSTLDGEYLPVLLPAGVPVSGGRVWAGEKWRQPAPLFQRSFLRALPLQLLLWD